MPDIIFDKVFDKCIFLHGLYTSVAIHFVAEKKTSEPAGVLTQDPTRRSLASFSYGDGLPFCYFANILIVYSS